VSCHFPCSFQSSMCFSYSRLATLLHFFTLPLSCSYSFLTPDLSFVLIGLLGFSHGSFRLHVDIHNIWYSCVACFFLCSNALLCFSSTSYSFCCFYCQLPTAYSLPNISGLHIILGYGSCYSRSWFVTWWHLGISTSNTISHSWVLFLILHCCLFSHY